MKKCTCQAHDDRTGCITSTGGALAALLLAMARLGVALGLAAWLVVLVLSEIATAMVFTLAGILGLFVWPSCG